MESSNTHVVDSSVFVALYRPNDTHHEKAKEFFASLEHQTLVVHPFVIQEVATVLCYSDGVAWAKAFLSDIENANNVRVTMLLSPNTAKTCTASV
jgi:predicted nucleic acid-binding protein